MFGQPSDCAKETLWNISNPARRSYPQGRGRGISHALRGRSCGEYPIPALYVSWPASRQSRSSREFFRQAMSVVASQATGKKFDKQLVTPIGEALG